MTDSVTQNRARYIEALRSFPQECQTFGVPIDIENGKVCACGIGVAYLEFYGSDPVAVQNILVDSCPAYNMVRDLLDMNWEDFDFVTDHNDVDHLTLAEIADRLAIRWKLNV